MTLTHHTWTPWHHRDNAIVRASEAEWKKPAKWSAAIDSLGVLYAEQFLAGNVDASASPKPQRVEMGADLFDGSDKPIVEREMGWELCVCHGCGATVLYTENHNCDSPMAARLPRRMAQADLRRDAFATIDATPNLDYLVCTRHPGNVKAMLPEVNVGSQQQADDRNERGELFRRNALLGVPITTQQSANSLLPKLTKLRDLTPVLFAVWEPVEPLSFTFRYPIDRHGGTHNFNALKGYGGWPHIERNKCRLDWLIIRGGENPVHPDWVRDAVRQCRDAGVKVWFDGFNDGSMKIQEAPDGIQGNGI